MSNLMNDIFSCVPNVCLEAESSTPAREFRPNPKKSKTGVFKAVIRFLPNPTDAANKSVIRKNVVRLTNPITNECRFVDCPSSVGKPDPIVDTYFKLRNSDNAVKREQCNEFSRKQRFASLIQVISCETDPTLNNRILVWNYGIKVWNKIESEMKPPIAGIEPKNPFNLLDGRVFIVSVKDVSGYPNYDDCQFVDTDVKTRAFRLGVTQADGTMTYTPITSELISNEKGREAISEFLTNSAPDTSVYEYHDWDEDTAQFVANVIRIYLSNESLSAQQATAALNQSTANPQRVGVGNPGPATIATNPTPNDLTAIMNGSTPASANSAPRPDLQLGLTSVPGSQSTGEGFNADSLGVPGIGDILGATASPTPQQNANDLSLDAILNQSFL